MFSQLRISVRGMINKFDILFQYYIICMFLSTIKLRKINFDLIILTKV